MTLKRIALAAAGTLAVLSGVPAAYLASLDAEQYRDVLVAAVEHGTGHALSVGGPVALSVSLSPAIALDDVHLTNPGWETRAEWLAAERIVASVDLPALLRGEIEVRRLALERPVLLLATDADGAHNWRIAREALDADDAPALRIEEIVVEDLVVTRHDARDGSERSARIDSLEIRAASADRLGFALEGTYGDRQVLASGEIGRVRDLLRGAPYPVSATVTIPGAQVKVDGTLESVSTSPLFAGEMTAGIGDVAVLRGADTSDASVAIPLEASGEFRASRSRVELDAVTVALADARATGALTVELGAERPRIAGTLSVDRLDDDLLRRASGRPARSATRGGLFSRRAFELDALHAADAYLELRAGELAWSGAVLRDVSTSVTLEQGRLEASRIRAGFLGTRARGSVVVDAREATPRMAVALSADRLPSRAFLRALGVESHFVDGPASIGVDVTSHGNSPAALMANLDGTSRLLMDDGRVRVRRTENLVAGLGGMLRASSEDGEWTQLSCWAADLEIADGVVRPNVLLLDTERATTVGEGSVDLAEQTIALKLTPYPKSFTLNVAVPFWVRGPLSDPDLAPDEFAVARRVGALALLAFPPTAVASLGTLAVASAATLGAGGAVAHDSKHPCLEILEHRRRSHAPGRVARAGPAKTSRNGHGAGERLAGNGLVPALSIGAVDH